MIKVSLREKKLKSDKLSLYLDYYPPIINPTTGIETRREFLNIHIFKNPKSQDEKKYNSDTLSLANVVKSKREVQIRNKEFGFKDNVNISIDLVGFYKRIVDDYYNKGSKSNYSTWKSSLNHFENFCIYAITTSQIDIQFVNRYRNYLLNANTTRNLDEPKRLSRNTAATYFKHFLSVLKQAYKENFIEKNLIEEAEYIKEEETHREYLTEEELTLLWKTPIKKEKVKHMAIFSALSGLRFVDINNLDWKKVYNDKHQGYYIQLREQKTKSIQNHPISETAYNILKSQNTTTGLVFGDIKYTQITRPLKEWLVATGINKKISFHNFRHSYATLQLANGTDIYTVSKLLGHKNVATTQIYTKVLDKNKIEAANRINLKLDGI
ncbi:site-specific integrase [Flavobacterium sp.]|jgi:integrase|uniref:tyrosine-type recombinase/integrase n=1 Tax=Flavobacterium sp. TaxID=239 RepID=UPI002A81E8FB|nr:site-specific integrase [Flavobacterium sp.]